VKAARSFFALFAGWAVAFVTQILWQVYRPGFGYVTDFEFFLFWPALFALVGWSIFGLPVVYLTPERLASRWYICILVGFAVCIVAYLLLVCSWAREMIRLIWFPAIIGAVGGFTYWLLGRPSIDALFAHSRSVAILVLCLAPWLAVSAFAFALWPAIIRVSPYLAFRFGASESRARAEYEIYSRIRPGDTFADLHMRYPTIFTEPIMGASGSGSAASFEWSYHITFDESRSRVANLEVKRQP
jgi:hypothetical protein